MRVDGRKESELRPVRLTPDFQRSAFSSVLIEWGGTTVLCAASVEESVPPFRLSSGGGWLTAEYNMLPGSTAPRKRRRSGGREAEIQRLIGRSLRMAIDLQALGPRTITIDCDVLQADGGTRVASITGGYAALELATERLQQSGALRASPLRRRVAAVSVGVVGGRAVLDLGLQEDQQADVDMNIVMAEGGELIEVQGTAERNPFSREQLDRLCELASQGVSQLGELQKQAVEQGSGATGTTQ